MHQMAKGSSTVNGSTPQSPKASPADGMVGVGVVLAFIGAVPLAGLWAALVGLGLVLVVAGVVRGLVESGSK